MGKRSSVETWAEMNGHQVTIVESSHGSARWKCSCGATMGGKWCGSAEEAIKRANHHLEDTAT